MQSSPATRRKRVGTLVQSKTYSVKRNSNFISFGFSHLNSHANCHLLTVRTVARTFFIFLKV